MDGWMEYLKFNSGVLLIFPEYGCEAEEEEVF